MFIENLLGSKAKVKILRVLSEVRTAYTLKSLKVETELSLSITHKATEELADEGILIRIKGTGKERLYKFNTDNHFAPSIFELFKVEKTRHSRNSVHQSQTFGSRSFHNSAYLRFVCYISAENQISAILIDYGSTAADAVAPKIICQAISFLVNAASNIAFI